MVLKTGSEIEWMAESARILVDVMRGVEQQIVPGAIPYEVDRWAENAIRSRGGIPAFKGYRGYPATLCISLNEKVVHGIPNKTPFREGDICSIDVGLLYKEFFSDMARTFPIGRIPKQAAELIQVAEESLKAGIEQFQEGNRLFDISYAIQSHAEEHGFKVVRDFVGHGIGRSLHEDPQVPNFGKPGTGPRLCKGLALAIEPMLNVGTHEVEVMPDNWTVRTRDRKLSAHVEDTVVLTENGPRVLTRLDN